MQSSDFILVFGFKLILILGFFYGMKYWVKKVSNSIPSWVTWILGVFFIFYQSFTMIDGILLSFDFLSPIYLDNPSYAGSVAILIAIPLYIYLAKQITKK